VNITAVPDGGLMPPAGRRPSRTDPRLTADLDVPGAFEGEPSRGGGW
jgi:hypothetical protein